ncbi:MAG: 1-acyl-sn-glycerol-3-phosphate acyltransferase [Alkalinema sp. RU_4_3]|nr:1-acyl-sn-glycerol-3-phosphate acyltransferase [Alkalinema sp. RU_4_3]
MLTALLNYPINPLFLSQQLLSGMGTQITVTGKERIPVKGSTLIVSNHRSAMDVAVLMAALNQPIHFACHHYMRQVPLLGEMMDQLGFLPLDEPKARYGHFFDRATQLLKQHQTIGIFPEGATPMVQETTPEIVSPFQRGFAHLALRAPIDDLVILPVAISAQHEINTSLFPVRWLQMFDASEPLFDRPGWHPLVLYHQVKVSIGTPIVVDRGPKQGYHGRKALDWVTKTTETCHREIQSLLT